MSNRTYVCIECRTSMRAPSSCGLKTDFRCRSCSGEVFEVSHRWRIPKRGDDKEWEMLRKKVIADQEFYRSHHRRQALSELAQIDRQIESVGNQKKETPAKKNKLERLYSKKKRILQTYRGLVDDYETGKGEQGSAHQSTTSL